MESAKFVKSADATSIRSSLIDDPIMDQRNSSFCRE